VNATSVNASEVNAAREKALKRLGMEASQLSGWTPPYKVTDEDAAAMTETTKNRMLQKESLQAHVNVISALTLPVPEPPIEADMLPAEVYKLQRGYHDDVLAHARYSLSVLQTIEGEKQIIVWDSRDPAQKADLKQIQFYVEQTLRFQGVIAAPVSTATTTALVDLKALVNAAPTVSATIPDKVS
jgi:hypothetical protein